MRIPVHQFLLAAALCFASLTAVPAPTAPSRAPEAEVKAAILFNMLLFAHWPRSGNNPDGRLSLCILEDNPTENALRKGFEGEMIEGMKLAIKTGGEAKDDLRACDAVFVGGNNPSALYRAAVAVRNRPVLVMGEGPMALENNAMVGLSLSGDRYLFDINLAAIRREGLEVSSKLVRLARKVVE